MMLPTDAAMTTRRSSLGGTLAGISLPYWLNAFPTRRLLRLVRPREQSRDCEEISEGVEEGAGGRVVQREHHESPEDVQRSLRSRELDQRKQAYEEDGGGNAASAPRPGTGARCRRSVAAAVLFIGLLALVQFSGPQASLNILWRFMVLSLDNPATRPFFDTLGDLLAVARLLARAYASLLLVRVGEVVAWETHSTNRGG